MNQYAKKKSIESEIRNLRQEIKDIEKNCRHDTYKLCLEETFSFDLELKSKCIVCGYYEKTEINIKEKRYFFIDEFTEDGEIYISESELNEIIKKGGYDFER